MLNLSLSFTLVHTRTPSVIYLVCARMSVCMCVCVFICAWMPSDQALLGHSSVKQPQMNNTDRY